MFGESFRISLRNFSLHIYYESVVIRPDRRVSYLEATVFEMRQLGAATDRSLHPSEQPPGLGRSRYRKQLGSTPSHKMTRTHLHPMSPWKDAPSRSTKFRPGLPLTDRKRGHACSSIKTIAKSKWSSGPRHFTPGPRNDFDSNNGERGRHPLQHSTTRCARTSLPHGMARYQLGLLLSQGTTTIDLVFGKAAYPLQHLQHIEPTASSLQSTQRIPLAPPANRTHRPQSPACRVAHSVSPPVPPTPLQLCLPSTASRIQYHTSNHLQHFSIPPANRAHPHSI